VRNIEIHKTNEYIEAETEMFRTYNQIKEDIKIRIQRVIDSLLSKGFVLTRTSNSCIKAITHFPKLYEIIVGKKRFNFRIVAAFSMSLDIIIFCDIFLEKGKKSWNKELNKISTHNKINEWQDEIDVIFYDRTDT
jgi:hypothetical protein